LQRPHDYGEVFLDMGGHLNKNGNRAVADALFKALQEDLKNA
jgi:[citrate (pro-3S)-lyase] ligase